MMLLDGKKYSQMLLDDLAKEVKSYHDQHHLRPGLATLLIGGDPASSIYVSKKNKISEKIGFFSKHIHQDQNVSQQEVIEVIDELNQDKNIHGILIQLPLPGHLDKQALLDRVHPSKDVDGFGSINCGRFYLSMPSFVPCTPLGIMELLKHHHISLEGRLALVIGRSNIVGRPMSMLLCNQNATVIMAHSKTNNLQNLCQMADVVVAAVGKAHLIKKEWVKNDAVVIDVGIHRTSNGQIIGDVDFDAVKSKASYITPVPGGVGPMTIAMLMKNTWTAMKAIHGQI